MKHRARIRRAAGSIFAAATLAVIALQGGVAHAGDVDGMDLSIWHDHFGTQAESGAGYNDRQSGYGSAGSDAGTQPEFKYVNVRR